eukprot:gene31305-38677_t
MFAWFLKQEVAAPRNSIYLVCKDYRTVRVTLSGFENSRTKVDTFVQLLSGMSFYSANGAAHEDPRSHLFAYKYCAYFSNSDFGWNVCDIIKEYVRQGLYDSPFWQIFDNSDWRLSETYPRYLALPAGMSEAEIVSAASFRSKNRLPVITYLHKKTGAVLTRSAQPMVGLTQKNCTEDAMLLNLFRTKGAEPKTDEDLYSKLYILDARGKIAATLNMAVGKGTEDVSMYQNAELIFCNIDNIHVMRSSACNLADTLTGQSCVHSSLKEVINNANQNDGSGQGYFSKVEESGWLRHLRLVIMASVFAAEKLHFEGNSVLIHCSDGWDRTAQTCSLTQILLDPYFRTLEGIAVLVEKEWCSFGHKFQDRCGHGHDSSNLPDERCPVFLQFLDALCQVMLQFPAAFEFSPRLLLFLADHVQSCLFGNFLGNSEKERALDLQVKESTKSIWAYILDHKALFLNKSRYTPYAQPLWPTCNISKMTLWERYWLRWDIGAHPNSLAEVQWHDDWGNGQETDPSYRRTSYTYVAKPKREFLSRGESGRLSPLKVNGSTTEMVSAVEVAAPSGSSPPPLPAVIAAASNGSVPATPLTSTAHMKSPPKPDKKRSSLGGQEQDSHVIAQHSALKSHSGEDGVLLTTTTGSAGYVTAADAASVDLSHIQIDD